MNETAKYQQKAEVLENDIQKLQVENNDLKNGTGHCQQETEEGFQIDTWDSFLTV